MAFTFHWKVGLDPPFIEFEANVTDVPAQTGLAEGEIDILTGRFGLTVIPIGFEMAGFPVAQVASEVNKHVMISPSFGAYSYAELVAPGTLMLFTLH